MTQTLAFVPADFNQIFLAWPAKVEWGTQTWRGIEKNSDASRETGQLIFCGKPFSNDHSYKPLADNAIGRMQTCDRIPASHSSMMHPDSRQEHPI